MTRQRPKAVIVGAGIGGLTLAAALRRVDIDVEIHERAGELRVAGSGLAVMSNAVAALGLLDIDLGLDKRGQVVESFAIRDTRGRLIKWLPLPEVSRELGLPSVSITRTDLHNALLDAIGDTPIHLGAAATGFETDDSGATVHFADGTHARGDVVIGADGFHSALRRQLTGPEEAVDGGYVCWLAVADFRHTKMPAGAVAHYWGSGQRFGLIDVGQGQFYWWGTKNLPASEVHDWQGGKAEILAAYDGWADEVLAAIRATPEEDILAVPARDRVFLERWGTGSMTLLGDAAHPMLASLGQGAAMAIEDAVVLARALGKATDLPAALRAYEDRRRERTRAVVGAARAMSDMEQLESPVRRLVRDTRLRLSRKSVLAQQQKAVLTFPAT
jgi:2-polyprenyl-6-methoxyphenol hydroxylase-like FAD-dependent oxidoreductase